MLPFPPMPPGVVRTKTTKRPSADHIGSSSVFPAGGFVPASRCGAAPGFAATVQSERCSWPNGLSCVLGPAETTSVPPEHAIGVPARRAALRRARSTDRHAGAEATAIPSPIVTLRPPWFVT